MLRLLGSQQLGARSFGGASQPAEEVQLERGVCGERQKVELRLEVLFFSPAEITVPLHLRQLIGARYSKLSAPGVDALRRQLEVIILLQGCADELLQLRVLEDLPPGKVCEGRGLLLGLEVFAQVTVHAWCRNDGPVVIRADHAPRHYDRRQNRSKDRGHQRRQVLHHYLRCSSLL